MIEPKDEWQGDTPVFLVIRSDEGHIIPIDLDEPGWATTHSVWMRVPGIWELADKTGRVRLRQIVLEGEQPYYTARHVGVAGSGGSNEITAYGIGKKLNDSSMVRLWLMPDGAVTGGDDIDQLGVAMVKIMGPR